MLVVVIPHPPWPLIATPPASRNGPPQVIPGRPMVWLRGDRGSHLAQSALFTKMCIHRKAEAIASAERTRCAKVGHRPCREALRGSVVCADMPVGDILGARPDQWWHVFGCLWSRNRGSAGSIPKRPAITGSSWKRICSVTGAWSPAGVHCTRAAAGCGSPRWRRSMPGSRHWMGSRSDGGGAGMCRCLLRPTPRRDERICCRTLGDWGAVDDRLLPRAFGNRVLIRIRQLHFRRITQVGTLGIDSFTGPFCTELLVAMLTAMSMQAGHSMAARSPMKTIRRWPSSPKTSCSPAQALAVVLGRSGNNRLSWKV